MKLDDRPVIEQLLNPTPLNIVHEVEAEAHPFIDGEEHITAKDVLDLLRNEVALLHLDLSERTMGDLDAALSIAADEVAERVAATSYSHVDAVIAQLKERLDR